MIAIGTLAAVVLLALTLWLLRTAPCDGRLGRAKQALVRARNAFLTGCSDRRTVTCAVVLSFGIHLVNFFGVFCLARALGINISYGEVLLMMPVVMFAILLPVTVNGSRKILPKKSLLFHPGPIEVVISDPIETTGCSIENLQDLVDKTREVITSNFNPNFPEEAS